MNNNKIDEKEIEEDVEENVEDEVDNSRKKKIIIAILLGILCIGGLYFLCLAPFMYF